MTSFSMNWLLSSTSARVPGNGSFTVALVGDDAVGRNSAVGILVKIGEPAVKPLIEALRSGEFPEGAAEVLGKIGRPAVGPLIAFMPTVSGKDKRFYTIYRCAARALVDIGEPAIDPLFAAWRDGDGEVRRHVAGILLTIGAPAIKPLIKLLADGPWNVRQNAAEALGRIGGERAIQALIAALSDIDGLVRMDVIRVLGRIGRAAVEPSIRVLQDTRSYIRTYAAYSLGEIGDVQAVEPLTAALNDTDLGVLISRQFRSYGSAAPSS